MGIMARFQLHILQNACFRVRMAPGWGHLCHFDTFLVVYLFLFFFTNYRLERSFYVKLKYCISNSVHPDETAHYEPSHLDLRCLQNPIIIAKGRERVKVADSNSFLSPMEILPVAQENK